VEGKRYRWFTEEMSSKSSPADVDIDDNDDDDEEEENATSRVKSLATWWTPADDDDESVMEDERLGIPGSDAQPTGIVRLKSSGANAAKWNIINLGDHNAVLFLLRTLRMQQHLVDDPRLHCAIRYENLRMIMKERYDGYRAAAEPTVNFLARRNKKIEWIKMTPAQLMAAASQLSILNFKLLKATDLDGKRKIEFRIAVQGISTVEPTDGTKVDGAEHVPENKQMWQWVANLRYTKLVAVHKHVKKYPLQYHIDVRSSPIPAPPPQRFLSKSYSLDATRQRQRVFGRMLKIVSDSRNANERNLSQSLPQILRSALIETAVSNGVKMRVLE
jgi:hypothetical protein